MSLTLNPEYDRIEEFPVLNITDKPNYDENSCENNDIIDNNDNSLIVTGEQNLNSNSYDDKIVCTVVYDNNNKCNRPIQQEQARKKALNNQDNNDDDHLSGSCSRTAMRQRNNLLFNMINSIMNYLGTYNNNNKNKNENCSNDNKKEKCDDDDNLRDDENRITMNNDKLDRCYKNSVNDCDNRINSNNKNMKFDEFNSEMGDESVIEYAFPDESDESAMETTEAKTKIGMVQRRNSFSVTLSSSTSRMRVALGVLIRLILPVANKLSKGWNGLRGGGLLNLINKIRGTKGLLTTLLALAANTVSMSLSSVQVTNRFDPILRVIKLKKDSTAASASSSSSLPRLSITSTSSYSSFESLSSGNTSPLGTIPKTLSLTYLRDEPAEKCVNCVVLAEPPPGQPITADIIFIHGLHGSLVNTWKQGLWKSEGRLEGFNRPPKPPIRPPKRQRHSRSTLVVPSIKRARYSDNFDIRNEENDTFELKHKTQTINYDNKVYTYECGDVGDVQYMDDVEYSFPTFRLRIDDLELNETVKQGLRRTSEVPNPKENANFSKCWPGEWLPLDCPGVRVIAVNYTTDPYLWRPVWVKKRNRSTLVDRAREMSDMLIEKDVGNKRPIIWVGHSKGGIFIKQMIVDAWESGRANAKNLFRSSRGCFFYSVPHRGSSLADFNLPLLRQSVELLEIQKDCPSILDLHRRFVALYRAGHLKVDVFSFVETALTLMSVLYLRIVTIDSADPGIGEVCGVHLDHREICKPRSRECLLYTELVKMINNARY
uniref:CSON012896 protein n=1 Tax=Culicoides sonorensis TaxID=179676 RepID=A0A336MIQ4_CULSO